MKLYVVILQDATEKHTLYRFVTARSKGDFYDKAEIEKWIGREEISLTICDMEGNNGGRVRTLEEVLAFTRGKIFRGEEFGVELNNHSWGARVVEFELDDLTRSILEGLGLLATT